MQGEAFDCKVPKSKIFIWYFYTICFDYIFYFFNFSQNFPHLSLPTELYILKNIKTNKQKTQWKKWINKTNSQKRIWSSFLVGQPHCVGVLPWNRLIYTVECHWRNGFPFLSIYQLHTASAWVWVWLCVYFIF